MRRYKRTAVAAAEVFLLFNEKRLAASNDQLEEITLAVAEGNASKGDTIAFFKKHTKKSRK